MPAFAMAAWAAQAGDDAALFASCPKAVHTAAGMHWTLPQAAGGHGALLLRQLPAATSFMPKR